MLQKFRGGNYEGYDNKQPEYHRMVPIKKGTTITADMYFDWIDSANIRLKAKHGSLGETWPSSPTQSQYYTLSLFTSKGNPIL